MLVSQFDFDLPEQLIAQYPLDNRTDSRLLTLQGGKITEGLFPSLLDSIQENDILVRNNTQVIPARLFGYKQTGGKIEILIERIIDNQNCIALIRSSKPPKKGMHLILENQITFQVLGRENDFFKLQLQNDDSLFSLLDQFGHIPLPPYIQRSDEQQDKSRYQTVYAKTLGAVAAPTAGLHFDQPFLNQIKQKGVEIVDLTLHVGAGTFQPMRCDDTEQHTMHKEWFEISSEACDKIQQAKAKSGRVIAVGTTSLRALESASLNGTLQAYTGDTDIFITPGFQFQTVDLLLTNFHLPKSTLLMLVSAFSGFEEIKQAYQLAIQNQYRFFSYGDAMLLHRKTS